MTQTKSDPLGLGFGNDRVECRLLYVAMVISSLYCASVSTGFARDGAYVQPSVSSEEAVVRLTYYASGAAWPTESCTGSTGQLMLTTLSAGHDTDMLTPVHATSASTLDKLIGGAIDRTQGISFPYLVQVRQRPSLRNQVRMGYPEAPDDAVPVIETTVTDLVPLGRRWIIGLHISVGVAVFKDSTSLPVADLVANGDMRCSIEACTAMAVEENLGRQRPHKVLARPVARLCMRSFRKDRAHVHRNLYLGLAIGAKADWADVSPRGMPGAPDSVPLFTWNGTH